MHAGFVVVEATAVRGEKNQHLCYNLGAKTMHLCAVLSSGNSEAAIKTLTSAPSPLIWDQKILSVARSLLGVGLFAAEVNEVPLHMGVY